MAAQSFKTILALIIVLFWANPVFPSERIVIPGTGDSQKILRTAAYQFELEYPEISVDIPDSVGSVGGIKRVLNQHAPLARIARELHGNERASGLESVVFAYTPVVVVANLPEPCIDNITTTELTGIYSGRIRSWKELGNCPDHKIYVANREEDDSSRVLLESSFPEFKTIKEYAGEIIYSTPETKHIIEDHPYTIGYLPQSVLKNSPLTQFSLNGLRPASDNLASGRYPLSIPLGFTWQEKPSGAYRQFVEFMFSATGQEIIRAHHAVPAPEQPDF